MDVTRAKFRAWAGLIAALALGAAEARAQQPLQAQLDAVRQSCRSDFIANCPGVTPGGKDALDCLKRNSTKLGDACQAAVNALGPPAPAAASAPPAGPAPVAAQPAAVQEANSKPVAAQSPTSELAAVRQTCTLSDITAHCSWIAPSNPELLLCLKANVADLSAACQSLVQSLPTPASRPAAPVPPKRPVEAGRAPGPGAPPSGAPGGAPSSQQAAAKAACRSDFETYCASSRSGGEGAAVQCLMKNSANLSAACRTAMAAVGGNGPPPGGASSEGGPPEGGPPEGAPDANGPGDASGGGPASGAASARPRDALGILQTCRADIAAQCQGVQLGGGRVIRCLAEHQSALSAQCRTAVSAISSSGRPQPQ